MQKITADFFLHLANNHSYTPKQCFVQFEEDGPIHFVTFRLLPYWNNVYGITKSDSDGYVTVWGPKDFENIWLP